MHFHFLFGGCVQPSDWPSGSRMTLVVSLSSISVIGNWMRVESISHPHSDAIMHWRLEENERNMHLWGITWVWLKSEWALADKREIEVLKSKKSMDVFEVESCVWGHHIYKHVWTPFVGEELTGTHEIENTKDPFAVTVVHHSTVCGHVPRKISATCALFLARNYSV